MGNRYTLFILLFYLTLITINSCDNLPAYRLLQYKSGTVVYGSKKAYVNLLTTTLTSAPNLKSRAIIIPIESASLAQFENVIQYFILSNIFPNQFLDNFSRYSWSYYLYYSGEHISKFHLFYFL